MRRRGCKTTRRIINEESRCICEARVRKRAERISRPRKPCGCGERNFFFFFFENSRRERAREPAELRDQ